MGHDHHHGHGHHHHHHGEGCRHHQHNGHGENHSHEHGSESGEGMTDQQKLKVLIEHWVKHNSDHKASLDEWVEKAAAMGLNEVSETLKKSADLLEESVKVLKTAGDFIK